ncbi:hypothetical protein ACOZ4I_17400 (plasmid) [Haloarcula salina]
MPRTSRPAPETFPAALALANVETTPTGLHPAEACPKQVNGV